jgi:hypothetical protein
MEEERGGCVRIDLTLEAFIRFGFAIDCLDPGEFEFTGVLRADTISSCFPLLPSEPGILAYI